MATKPTKVLLIDDDDSDYFLTKDMLAEIDPDGFEIDWKANYETGLEALCSGNHDICLLDNRLGARSGIDLLSDAKGRGCFIPVIILTGQSERDVDYSAMKLGAADFLEKKELTAAKLDRAIRYTLLQHLHSGELEKLVSARTKDLAATNLALHSEIAAREKTDQALKNSEERFRHLASAMPQIVWISEPDGSVEYINSQWVVYTGLTLEESRNFEMMKGVIHPDDWQPVQESWQKAVETQSIHENELRIKHTLDGNYRWFLLRSVPVFNASGEVIKWYGTSTDIHDQKLQEEEQRLANQRKDVFLASMAHELRNPLPPIRNALEIMRLADNNPQTIERCRGMIERQLNQIIRLVDDLLDLSRFTRGKITLRMEPVEISAIIEAAVETSRPLIEAAQHTLTVLVPPEKVYFEGDSTRITQAVVNLLNNAAKYTSPKGEIILSATVEGEQIVIKVSDNGMGIPAEMLQSIFQMFNQLPRSEQHGQGGLGIGLALVKGIIELHHGTIEAKSPGIGKGSEFIVKLPISHTAQPIASSAEMKLDA
ncbi:MAG: ATP-binding protein [Gemmatales bacterium]